MKYFIVFFSFLVFNLFSVINLNSIIYKESETSKDSLRLTVKITGIKDGDTAEGLYNGEFPLQLRLGHVDAPEKRGGQAYWQQSKQKLSDLCFGQTVRIASKGKGQYDMGGRMIVVITNEQQQNVNLEMVRSGYAWHFKKYSDDRRYDDAEKYAKGKKLGIWRADSQIKPEDFRKNY